MKEASDNPEESQSETPNATPQPQLPDTSLEGAPVHGPKGVLHPEIVVHVKRDGGLGKTGQD